MAPKFVAEEGLLKGLVLTLENGDEWIIGRDPDECQLLVEDPSASRKHLLCRKVPLGIVAENLSATNPVRVNFEELKEPRILQQGDAVSIGSGLFRFYTEVGSQVDNLGPNSQALTQGKEAMQEDIKEDIDLQEEHVASKQVQNEEEKEDSIFQDAPPLEEDALADIHFSEIEKGRWLLKVVSGPNNGAEFSMEMGKSYILGTDPNSCDIIFNDVSVSRQHAKLTLGEDEKILIEDLKSRNGTAVEGKNVTAKETLPTNTLVSLGTTTFLVLDREKEQHTVISPLLPAIVKVLTQEDDKKMLENKQRDAEMHALREHARNKDLEIEETKKLAAKKNAKSLGPMVLIAIVTGLFVLTAFGISTLLNTKAISLPKIDVNEVLKTTLSPYPSLSYSYSPTSGQLLLLGHVLTTTDRQQLLYKLQSLPFIDSLNDQIIIDESIWSEANQVLSKNPNWRGVTIHSPSPGRFVMTGYLQSRRQAQLLNDWIGTNFPYVDRLEKRVIVEEDLMTQINVILQEAGFRDLAAKLNNGELTLSGNIPSGMRPMLDQAIDKIKGLIGIRSVQNFIVELSPKQAVINISNNYKVSGSSVSQNGEVTSVSINGRILSKGGILDGMTIQSIDNSTIQLEKDGVKYIIEYNR